MNKKELKQILAEGESYKIEFKEQVSNIDKDIVAFSNSAGGRVFIGIHDNGTIYGLKNFNRLKSEIETIAHNCDPSIKVTIEKMENILIVNVREGVDKPYRCKTGFYTRNGANSQKLTRNEIVGLVISEGKVPYDELKNKKFNYKKHFDSEKLNRFLRLANITKVLDTPSLLLNLGVAERQKGKLIFNNAGIFLFAKDLENIYYHTTVTCALFRGTEKVEVLDRKDFNEDIISNIDDAMNFLKKHIPVRYEMTGTPRRKEIPEIPFDALREAVINAVVHRDYFEKGANAMVEIYDDRIEIYNPGGLVKGLKPEEIGKKSMLRNPLLAGLLNRIRYIEKMGTGITKMQRLMNEASLSPVEFEFDSFFTAIFRRPLRVAVKEAIKVTDKVTIKVTNKVTENQTKILDEMKKNAYITTKELSKRIGISDRKIKSNISKLKRKGLLKRIGPAKGGYWEVLL